IAAVFSAVRLVLGFGGMFGFAGRICIFGWLAAFYMNIVVETCAGNDDMPGITMEDGFFGDIVQPSIRFIATAVVAFLPLGLFVACRMYSQIPRELTLVLAAGALGVGLFLWPIVMLLFSLKTASTLLQIHLVIMTVVRTILPYLALWLML